MAHICRNYRVFLLPLALMLAAAAVLAADVPIAKAFATWRNTKPIKSYLGYFDMFEFFGHGLGVAVLLVAFYQLDPGRRWAFPRVFTCVVAGGAAANLVKLLIGRTRPFSGTISGTVWSTFGPWFPGLNVGSTGQSFPSAHTATAVAFAAALTWLYPQGRLLFSVLAALVGCQRIVCGAHYPSDVLVGATAGYLAAQLVLKIGLLPQRFNRWEARWRSK